MMDDASISVDFPRWTKQHRKGSPSEIQFTMGTCLSTQSAGRRTRRGGRVSISPSSAEHAADRNNNNNCGGRSGDDSGSQQQGGSGSNSDSVTSTSPAPGGGLGPSTTTTRGGGGGADGDNFSSSPQSGQEWTGVEEQSSPPQPRCSPPSAANRGDAAATADTDYDSLSSNKLCRKQSSTEKQQQRGSNPLPPSAVVSSPQRRCATNDGCGEAQGFLPMTHSRLSSPFVEISRHHQSGGSRGQQQQQPFSPKPPPNADNDNKEASLSRSAAVSTQRNASNAMGEGEQGRTLPSMQLDPQRVLVIQMPTANATSSSTMPFQHSPKEEVQDGNRLTADQLSLKSAEENRLDVSSAPADLSMAAQPADQRESGGAATASQNSTHQAFLGASFTSSGINSGSSPWGGGGRGGGGSGSGSGSGGGGDTGSRVVFCSSGGGSVGYPQHHRHRSSPRAMIDMLRTNNPNSNRSPSASTFVFDSAGISGGGIGDGGGGGGGGGSGASAHGDPQLGPSMCSSWDSSDYTRARISQADAQTTMQTVATASLFASSTF